VYVCTQTNAHWKPKYSVAEDNLAAILFVKLNVNLILAKGRKTRCMAVCGSWKILLCGKILILIHKT
jgi:hypothetical protein